MTSATGTAKTKQCVNVSNAFSFEYVEASTCGYMPDDLTVNAGFHVVCSAPFEYVEFLFHVCVRDNFIVCLSLL